MTAVLYVWDLPLRLCHWLLAAALAASYVTGQQGGLWLDWHARLGLFILALMVFRLVWGFVGTTFARFASFYPTFRRLKEHLAASSPKPGHNPFGALAIFSLFLAVLAQAGTGLFAVEDESEFYGPLNALVTSSVAEKLTAWHAKLIYLLLVLTLLHMGAIAYYWLGKGRNLVAPMLNGKCAVAADVAPPVIDGGGWPALLLALGIAAMTVWLVGSGTVVQWFA